MSVDAAVLSATRCTAAFAFPDCRTPFLATLAVDVDVCVGVALFASVGGTWSDVPGEGDGVIDFGGAGLPACFRSVAVRRNDELRSSHSSR